MTGAAPAPPPEAERVFADRLPLATRYAELLATTGTSHGLLGPRETPRLWERHLVNCAVMHPLLAPGSEVADIGSGAGLPGLVLAVVRPDLQVHLIEPLLRRTTWLETAVEELGLDNVRIHRGRAEEVTLQVPVVTARAVASLDKLVAWSFPLLAPAGRLLALKGEKAAQELAEAQSLLDAWGVTRSELQVLGEGEISEPVRVVVVERPEHLPTCPPGAVAAKAGGRGGRARKGRSS
ncbi:16S rRNA (guanine(527)-N(7))-methyltransferase RsmG [Ornithinimicrobium flavum]|uniref:16S rRNA (guanine(527)-N(7))-methyltransferase RsmG n=1 Tax=Ornithinimicrobium flavum TaxID=1288636 RepID=UPI00106F534A|nr:16S rRNA (guanine(527)-N(7))-methyltransferase RsmG [Ornithinimicrobium flavum]